MKGRRAQSRSEVREPESNCDWVLVRSTMSGKDTITVSSEPSWIIITESRGRVVTRWPGSQEVGDSIPGCATKFVRCKNLAFNIGQCVSRGSDTT